jgi:hypothetical protein
VLDKAVEKESHDFVWSFGSRLVDGR